MHRPEARHVQDVRHEVHEQIAVPGKGGHEERGARDEPAAPTGTPLPRQPLVLLPRYTPDPDAVDDVICDRETRKTEDGPCGRQLVARDSREMISQSEKMRAKKKGGLGPAPFIDSNFWPAIHRSVRSIEFRRCQFGWFRVGYRRRRRRRRRRWWIPPERRTRHARLIDRFK